MQFQIVRVITISTMAYIALLIASCAQQSTKPVPTSPAPAGTNSPPATQSAAPKPKPKPKPVPKPETEETETAPVLIEGLEPSKVGYYFDTLQGRLRQVADPNLTINREGNEITVDLTQSVHLDNESASTSCIALAPIAKALVEYRMTHAIIDVAAESSEAASVRLAKSRSESIAKCFADAGVASRRIASHGVAGTASTIKLRIDPIVRKP